MEIAMTEFEKNENELINKIVDKVRAYTHKLMAPIAEARIKYFQLDEEKQHKLKITTAAQLLITALMAEMAYQQNDEKDSGKRANLHEFFSYVILSNIQPYEDCLMMIKMKSVAEMIQSQLSEETEQQTVH
jgi:hypothetical protein